MSKVHILEADNKGNYKVVIHSPVPPGNNSAGKAWKDCLTESGANTSVMTGLTTQEATDIQNGDVIETVASVKAESGGASQASLNAMVDSIISGSNQNLATRYKYYGYNF